MRTGVPTPMAIKLGVEQNDSPNVPASSTVKSVTVVLPEGIRVNPATAGGLRACSDAEMGMTDTDAPRCEEGSKLGNVEVKTPLLRDPLIGAIFQGEQMSGAVAVIHRNQRSRFLGQVARQSRP